MLNQYAPHLLSALGGSALTLAVVMFTDQNKTRCFEGLDSDRQYARAEQLRREHAKQFPTICPRS